MMNNKNTQIRDYKMRITKSEVRGMFSRLVKAVGKREDGGSYNGLVLDYAPIYGGYVIEQQEECGGISHPFGCMRRSAKEMYLSMLMAAQALENMKYEQSKEV